MSKEYFFLYLIYGSAFINMGIFAIQKKEVEVSNFPLVKALKYLGFFGITHGISEWVSMVVIADLYPEFYISLFILKQVLKAISFACLLFFGISLLPMADNYRKLLSKIPVVLLTFWLVFFVLYMIRFGQDYHLVNPQYNIIWLRYVMGFPGGILAAVSFYLSALHFDHRLKEVAKKYKTMAYIFLLYSILDGVIVREMNFFPANIINNTLFMNMFGFPIQIAKTMVGIGINYILIRVIQTFGWEQKEKLNQLQKSRITSEERRKLGMEIHDGIIQGLYAAGLKTEYLRNNKNIDNSDEMLKDIKDDLNSTIAKTREFLASSTLEVIEVEDFKESIAQLVDSFNNSNSVAIALSCQMPTLTLKQLSAEKSTQIFYIVQEALSNVVKHAKASEAVVSLTARYDTLHVQISDNGIGIIDRQKHNLEHVGLASMRQRAKSIGGKLTIEKVKRGTKVELQIPWEVRGNAAKSKSFTG